MKELTDLAKIFSDINRIKITAILLRDKEACVCELCDTLELSQPLVSRHLKQMKEGGVLEAKQEGKWVIYSLNENPKPGLKCWLNEIGKQLCEIPKIVTCKAK